MTTVSGFSATFFDIRGRSRWQRGFVNYTAVSGGLEVFVFVASWPVSLSVRRARALWGDNTVRAAPSLLLLFMQQPGAVAGCAKDPGVQQTCPQNRSGGAVLLSFQKYGTSCGLLVSKLCFPGLFEPRVRGGRCRFCRVGAFAAWTKDWME